MRYALNGSDVLRKLPFVLQSQLPKALKKRVLPMKSFTFKEIRKLVLVARIGCFEAVGVTGSYADFGLK